MVPISFASLVAAGKVPSRSGGPPGSFDAARLDRSALLAERARVVERTGNLRPPITRMIPVPRAITLGARVVVVSELRLRHLAQLQAYLEDCEPHPLDGMPPSWADPEPATRRARLVAAWEASASWPPRLGTARGSAMLNSAAGRAYFLWVLAREHDLGFTLADALAAIGEATPAQWAALTRVAWAILPRLEIAAELAPDRSPDKPHDWVKSLWLAAGEAGRAAQFPTLADLTLSQWRAVCGEGKAAEFTPEYSAACKRVRAILDAPEPAEACDG